MHLWKNGADENRFAVDHLLFLLLFFIKVLNIYSVTGDVNEIMMLRDLKRCWLSDWAV